MVLLLSLVAAVLFAAGYVLQYHEAHEAPKGLFLSPRLLVELARHRIWVLGILVMFAGDGVQAVALGKGSLAIVEPVLTTSLLFALPLSAAWRREKLRTYEWVGAISVSAGLGVLLGVGSPTAGSSTMPARDWLLVALASWGVALAMVAAGKRSSSPSACAGLIGGAAGVLFGLQDALTRFCLHGLSTGFGSLVLSWQPYVLLVSAIYGIMLTQSAYEAGPLPAALPPIAVGEPVAGMLIGLFALDEHLHASPGAMAVEAAAAAVMVFGTWLLGRSRLVCGKAHPEAQAALAAARAAAVTLPEPDVGDHPPVSGAPKAPVGAAARR